MFSFFKSPPPTSVEADKETTTANISVPEMPKQPQSTTASRSPPQTVPSGFTPKAGELGWAQQDVPAQSAVPNLTRAQSYESETSQDSDVTPSGNCFSYAYDFSGKPGQATSFLSFDDLCPEDDEGMLPTQEVKPAPTTEEIVQQFRDRSPANLEQLGKRDRSARQHRQQYRRAARTGRAAR